MSILMRPVVSVSLVGLEEDVDIRDHWVSRAYSNLYKYISPGITYGGGDADGWVWCLLGREHQTDPRQGGSEGLLDGDLICWKFPWRNPSLHRDQGSNLSGMDVGSVNVPCLLARYLRLFAAGKKKAGLIITEGLFLPMIDMAELVRLQISVEHDNTWAWVAMGPERQPDASAGALANAEDAPIIDEGGQADPTPVQAPQQPPSPPPAPARTIPQSVRDIKEDVQGPALGDVGSIMWTCLKRSMTDHGILRHV
ncbi:hypothetical protein Tco_0522430 [Tanacetum coccineum]